MSRDHEQAGAAQGQAGNVSSHGTGASDEIAKGHLAVQHLEGGMVFPRISTWAATAIEQQNFVAAREASMQWYVNKPFLRTLAQSLDPRDRQVVRAQALLNDMAPLEAKLPNLFEVGFMDDEAAKGRARWLARIGGAAPRKQAAAQGEDATAPGAPVAAMASTAAAAAQTTTMGAAALQSPPRPTNVKLELTGLAGVFRLYQRHRDTAALETAYATNTVDDGSGVASETSQSDAAYKELDVALRANGFADLRAFEALVRQYERDFGG